MNSVQSTSQGGGGMSKKDSQFEVKLNDSIVVLYSPGLYLREGGVMVGMVGGNETG